jgi:hypothetical protein
MQVSFDVSTDDASGINRVIEKAIRLKMIKSTERMHYEMNLCATVAQGCQIDFARMLDNDERDNFDFAHDLFGIDRHLDRSTGRLLGCFVPRFAISNRVAGEAA